MSGLNRWVGIINLAADAELRYSQGGAPILNFRGACNETYQVDGEKKETTTWVNCVLFGKRGEALQRHLAKGTKLYVEGALRIGTYEKDGEKKTKVEIHVREVEFMGGGKSSGAGEEHSAPRGNGGSRGGGQRSASGGSRPTPGGYGGGSRAPVPPADAGGYSDQFSGGENGPDSDIPFASYSMSHDLKRWGL